MSMKEKQVEGKGKARLDRWEIAHARKILIAIGRIASVDVADMDQDQMREIVENVRHSQRMREPDFAEFRQRC